MSRYAAKIIGDQLRRFRISRGLSVAEAARVLDVKRQMVYNYENGRSLPSLEVLARAANKWNETFFLEGCKVFPQPIAARRPEKPLPVQQVFPFRKPRVYQKASVKITERKREMIITIRNGF
jgi:transcriptional regulator with XRE-family HTH domain